MLHRTPTAAVSLLALLAALGGGCVNQLDVSDAGGGPEQDAAISGQKPYEQEMTSDSWTLVVLPDTQDYAASQPEILEAQADWLLEQRDKLDIRMVAHVGDIVNEDVPVQWERARAALGKLAGELPVVLVPGNHDFVGIAQARESMMDTYFPKDAYLGGGEHGNFEDHSWNTYQVIDSPTQKWLFIGLEFAPRDEVLAWANQVIAAHSTMKVVMVTHLYLFSDGTRFDYERYGEEQIWNPFDYALDPDDKNDGEQMWQKLMKKHANARLVLCGHALDDGVGLLTSVGNAGNRVHQVLANYQWPVVDRGVSRAFNGYLRVMRFYDNDTRVDVRTYSPYIRRELTDSENEFTLSLEP